MAVYNQVLTYTFRDSLASGNPQKVIFGAYLDGEFGAIHTASLDAVSLSQNNTIAGNNSFTGTNTFSGATITTTFAGKIVVGAPTSGTAIIAQGTTSGINNAFISQSTDSAYQLSLGYNYGTANFINSSGTVARALQIQIGNTAYATWAASGNLTLSAPTSGVALTVSGLNASDSVLINSTGAAAGLGIGWNVGLTASQWNIFTQSTDPLVIGTAGAAGVNLSTNSAQRLTINSTGNVTVNAPASGNALTITPVANANGLVVNAPNTASQSFGAIIQAGTNSSDYSFKINNAATTTTYFQVRGDGVVSGNDGTNLFELGYKDVPENSQSISYTCVLSDRGKVIAELTSGTTLTIPANASVAYPVGTVLTFANLSGGNISIAINSDSMTLAGTATTGTRTLASNGLATAMKLVSTGWLISGAGLT